MEKEGRILVSTFIIKSALTCFTSHSIRLRNFPNPFAHYNITSQLLRLASFSINYVVVRGNYLGLCWSYLNTSLVKRWIIVERVSTLHAWCPANFPHLMLNPGPYGQTFLPRIWWHVKARRLAAPPKSSYHFTRCKLMSWTTFSTHHWFHLDCVFSWLR